MTRFEVHEIADDGTVTVHALEQPAGVEVVHKATRGEAVWFDGAPRQEIQHQITYRWSEWEAVSTWSY